MYIYIYIYVNQWKTTTNTSFINARSFISLQDNHQLKIVTNLQMTMTIYQMVWNYNDLTPEAHPHLFRHKRLRHTAKRFDGSHLLIIFAEQLILDAWKCPGCLRHCQISEQGLQKHGVLLKCRYKAIAQTCSKEPLF